jgi:dihydrofolate reductase
MSSWDEGPVSFSAGLLPGRINLVVSRNLNFHAEGLIIVRSVEAALSVALKYEEVFVVGGASLYGQVLPRADHIYLTVVHAEFTGDTHFRILTATSGGNSSE